MADIRVTSTGKPFYQIDSAVAAALLEAFPASFEKIEPKPTHNVVPQSTPTTPRWIIRNAPLSGKPQLLFAAFNQETSYPGPNCTAPTANGAQAAFTATGHPVPEDVLAKFSALLEHGKGHNPDSVNEARFQAQNKQYAREQNERVAETKVKVLG